MPPTQRKLPRADDAAASRSDDLPLAFVDGPIEGVVVRPLAAHVDPRGWLIEVFRQDEIAPANWPMMAYVSQSEPGAVRGPHEHVAQSDLFAFLGPGDFAVYLWDIRPDSPSRGRRMKLLMGESNRRSVLIPAGVVHAYKNTSATPGWVINLPNRLHAGPGRGEPVDEIRYEDRGETRFGVE
ncbi:MAG: dTDP-4-dehydrorhamnose 3,5-epimerase family protein [Pirellulales bacterium]|nr:dTDP-4-dehydrorhamnose 3,5-epimerase family protein [Pirellulales bacterium]